MSFIIRYLKQWEKQETRNLYETAFPQDSKAFVNYYYQWKTRDNEIIVMEEDQSQKDGFFQVMIHLNPYFLWINGKQEKVPYLVAVAADPGCRRQGKMRQVMYRLLQDLEQNKMPFTFLLPADPAYYKGQGFVFFPDMNLTGIGKETEGAMLQAASAQTFHIDERSNLNWQKAVEKDISEMMRYSNKILRERHDMVINRDEYYYQRLLAETEVEHGGILLLRDGRNLCGMLTYAANVDEMQLQGSCKAEVKELLLEEVVSEEEGRRICQNALQEAGVAGTLVPEVTFSFEKMMVRIISLMETVPLMRSLRRRCFHVKVTDPVIEANNGCFQIILDWDGGRIERTAEEEAAAEMDISRLTEELWKDVSVYLNEWV